MVRELEDIHVNIDVRGSSQMQTWRKTDMGHLSRGSGTLHEHE